MRKTKESRKGKRLHRKIGPNVRVLPMPKDVEAHLWAVALESLDDKVYLLDKQHYFSDRYRWRVSGRPLATEFQGQILKKAYA